MIQVGEYTSGFLKQDTGTVIVAPDLPTGGDNTEDALAVIQDISQRLQDLEGKVVLKADKSKLMSQIQIANEAILIASDRIGMLGGVAFADWQRDVNGTATGVIDPSITLIRGGVIQTEQIKSGNWGENAGSNFDLDDGHFRIGGSSNPKLEYVNDTKTLTVKGTIAVDDDGADYGRFKTGSAEWTGGLTGTGTGINIGTKGIIGLKNGATKFVFDAGTGDAQFGGNVVTSGYVWAQGYTDLNLVTQVGGTSFDVYSANTGTNTAIDTAGDMSAGVVGRVIYNPAITNSLNVGVLGEANSSNSSGYPVLKIGVLGVASQDGRGVYGESEDGYGGQFVSGTGIALRAYGGTVGLHALSYVPSAYNGVYSTGDIETSTHFRKNDNTEGWIRLFDSSYNLIGSYRYDFTN